MAEITVDLGPHTNDVDRYASDHGVTREQAVLDLIAHGLTGPVNVVNGTVSGTSIQAREIHGPVNF